MECLPDEVLATVLEQLPLQDRLAAARVCRRWAGVVRRRLLLVRRRGQEARASPATAALLVTTCLADLVLALSHAPRLCELTMHARVPLDDAMLITLTLLPRLRHLDVFMRSRLIDGRVLPVAASLRSLVINDAVEPGVLRSLAAVGRSLEALHMYGRSQYYPPRDLVALLTARRDHLRELTLRCCELKDSAYEAIGRCAALDTLRLYSCWMLTEAGAAHVVQPRRLRALHVTGARMLRPHALLAFIGALPPRVEELVLSAGWLGDEHVAALGASPPAARLCLLEAWRCRLTASGVRAIAAALPALQDLDVDVALASEDMAALARHPVLRRLRCAWGGAGEALDGSRGALCVRWVEARVGRGALRGGGEGLRAELYYSWAGQLSALPPAALPPVFDDDSEDDYSLLGTDYEDD